MNLTLKDLATSINGTTFGDYRVYTRMKPIETQDGPRFETYVHTGTICLGTVYHLYGVAGHQDTVTRICNDGVAWLQSRKQTFLRACVGGHKLGSGPDVWFVKVQGTEKEFADNGHHMRIEQWARSFKNFVGPIWVCTEQDPGRAVLRAWNDWDNVPVIISSTEEKA